MVCPWDFATEHLDHHASKAPDISTVIMARSFEDFRCHEVRGSLQGGRQFSDIVVVYLGDDLSSPKI